jgi:hypothetical protein
VNHDQTQKITPQNGHVEPEPWRLSHGKSEYKYRYVSGKSVFWHNGELQTLSAVPGDSSYPNRRLSNIIRINFSGELFRPLFTGKFRRRMVKGN